jgi:bifunctional enzyme CysN/CysC
MHGWRLDVETDLLRFTTVGSVDDGKSTLVGRLLYDTRSLFADQVDQLDDVRRRLGESRIDLALVTDGLRAEREQKITVDVGYRYFATSRRKFIIADTPGHVQYTRNMVTGASTADLAIIILDATKGVLTQTRRHAFIASLLGISHIIVAINKMDLVGYDEAVYDAIVADFAGFASKLTVSDISYLPVSALEGDNVVISSEKMPWFEGGSLLHRLETVNAVTGANPIDFRFPVQLVIRPHQSFRGYAGTIASGSIRTGEEIVVLPAGQSTNVKAIQTAAGPTHEAVAGEAVLLTTTDDIDISRGDMIVRRHNLPSATTHFEAYLCWMDVAPLVTNRSYVLLHTTRQVVARVMRVHYCIDVDTMHRAPARTLNLNDIGRVEMATGEALFFDQYRLNRATGSFILVDPHTNLTVAAGMIRGEVRRLDPPSPQVSRDAVWHPWNIPREEREARHGHRAAVIWFTGRPAAGKTTIAKELERRLFERGLRTMLLDGDQLRHGLCGDLGFSPSDRSENIRRAGEVARLFYEQGSLVLCTFVSPYRKDRDLIRALFPRGRFIEVLVTADDTTLARRDPKGFYARAQRGDIEQFTGFTAPYEEPLDAEIVIDTDRVSVADAVHLLMERLVSADLISA